MKTLNDSDLEGILAGSYAKDLGFVLGNIAGFLYDGGLAAWGNNPMPIADRVGLF